MDLELRFVDGAGVSASVFPLTEEDGRYALPRLMLMVSDGEAWPEDAVITSCEVSPPEPAALRQALLAEWGNTGPLGHGSLIHTDQRWLPARHLRVPVEVRVSWAVTYYDRGPYERFTNNVPPLRKEASVTLRFAPPVPEREPGDDEEPVVRSSSPVHRGHVAVDFGTSNCTATLFDQSMLPVGQVLSHEQVSNLRTSILKLLDHGPWPGVSAEEFPELIADIATAMLRDTSGGDDALRVRLRTELAEDNVRNPRVLYHLLVEVERRLGQCSEELRPQLAAVLSQAYSQAWRVAPLDRLRLFEVQLDPSAGKVIESKVTVATTSPELRVKVGAPLFGLDSDDEHAAEPLIYAGLKQKLGSPERHRELGAGATSDDLIREALRNIIERCDDFIEKGAEGIGRGRVNHVVITFPTMASPAVRQKLRKMVNDVGVSIVDNSYDEAIAAAMFTLLRDFGGDHDTGLELLRSRSRPAGEGRWKQNLLVIDIGGGTTDIALLALHLRNETPGNLGDESRLGRYYELLPELLGSTGRLQLGGELTSLRVFYWIKAMLGDQLLRAQPDSFGPAVAALRMLKLADDPSDGLFSRSTWRELPKIDEGSGTDIFGVLDEIVPTRSAPPYGRPSQAFWLLWTLADRVKRDFCALDAPPAITLGPRELGQVLQAAEWPAAAGPAPDVASLPEDALTLALTRERFDDLVAPDLREIMELAYRLAGERLAGTGDAEQVDRIILTGQASRAPQVRQQLLATFSEKHDETVVRWHPSAVVVESDYAKAATSLGACWAMSNQGLARRPKGAEGRLREGRNEFRIIVDNLFFNLPCSFIKATIFGGQKTGERILPIGAELYQIYPDKDIAVIRSSGFELTNIVAIYRDGQGDLPEWGDFQWREVDPGRSTTIWPHEIRALLEVTSNLDLFLLLSRGPAHYQVDGEAIQVRDALPGNGASGSPPAFAPDRIVVNAYSTDGDHAGTEIFTREAPAPDADQDQPADSEVFPETFHSPAEPAGAPGARGAISGPLPPPPVGGSWTFHYRDDQGDLQMIGALSPPPRESQLNIRYYATVDEHGNLRLHDGAVPYWPAASLEDVEARPGAVYRTPMYPTDKDYNPARDPFNGRH